MGERLAIGSKPSADCLKAWDRPGVKIKSLAMGEADVYLGDDGSVYARIMSKYAKHDGSFYSGTRKMEAAQAEEQLPGLVKEVALCKGACRRLVPAKGLLGRLGLRTTTEVSCPAITNFFGEPVTAATAEQYFSTDLERIDKPSPPTTAQTEAVEVTEIKESEQ